MVRALLVLKIHFSQNKYLSVCSVQKEVTIQIKLNLVYFILLVPPKLLSIKKLNFVSALFNILLIPEDNVFLAIYLSIGIRKKNLANSVTTMNITILPLKVVFHVL